MPKLRKKKPTPTPPTRGATVDLPKGADTIVRLIEDISARRVDPKTLDVATRRAVVAMMANGKQTSSELAAVFGVSPASIRTDLKVIREEIGREVRSFSLEEVVGQLYMAKEKCAASAMKLEDPGLAWSIERDFVDRLKALGLVGPSSEREGLRVTIEQIGGGYDRARQVLERVSPVLVGEVVDHASVEEPSRLPLSGRAVPEGDDEEPAPED